jgi:glycosyltransferase involved in cell wall biosynthesis
MTGREAMRKQLNAPTEARIVGMVGAFSELKDYHTYYAAARILLEKYPDIIFLAIGKGTDSGQSRNLIGKEYLDHFRLLGRKSDVESYINAMDISVLSTFTEGISNFILESMAIAKPVVATAGGGTCEILVDQETGFLVNPSNPAQMAEKIERLINDPDLCEKMGKAGLERVKNGFAIDQMIDRYVILYKLILKKA